jgi:hypothetical protein
VAGKSRSLEADPFAGQQLVVLVFEFEQGAHLLCQAVSALGIYLGGMAAELVDVGAQLIGQFEFLAHEGNEFICLSTAL